MRRSSKWFIILGCSAVMNAQEISTCGSFTADRKEAITEYVRKLIRVTEGTPLAITDWSTEGSSCYRRLTVSITGRRPIKLFLSPDQRFIVPALFDSQVDPADAERAEIEQIRTKIDSYLAKHSRPMLGKEGAPITIAVFSDFQCPFCRRELQVLTEEIAPAASGVRIAYLNYPSSGHPWARQAAESTVCLGPKTFWRIGAFLFDHQSELTPRNFEATFAKQLSGDREADAEPQSCADSAQRVSDDIAFGDELGVTVTPTLFVNGRPLVGVKNSAAIQELISAQARQ
jgi:protein-disulfide isomerase